MVITGKYVPDIKYYISTRGSLCHYWLLQFLCMYYVCTANIVKVWLCIMTTHIFWAFCNYLKKRSDFHLFLHFRSGQTYILREDTRMLSYSSVALKIRGIKGNRQIDKRKRRGAKQRTELTWKNGSGRGDKSLQLRGSALGIHHACDHLNKNLH